MTKGQAEPSGDDGCEDFQLFCLPLSPPFCSKSASLPSTPHSAPRGVPWRVSCHEKEMGESGQRWNRQGAGGISGSLPTGCRRSPEGLGNVNPKLRDGKSKLRTDKAKRGVALRYLDLAIRTFGSGEAHFRLASRSLETGTGSLETGTRSFGTGFPNFGPTAEVSKRESEASGRRSGRGFSWN